MSIRGKVLVLFATTLILLIVYSEASLLQQTPANQISTKESVVPAMLYTRWSFWKG